VSPASPLLNTFKRPFYASEEDADGNLIVDAGDSAVVTSGDSTKATIAADAAVDPAKLPAGADPTKYLLTGYIVGVKGASGDVDITCTYAHTDSTPPPAPQVITIPIVAGTPAVGVFGTGTDVAQ
jgi:hypothetical protein